MRKFLLAFLLLSSAVAGTLAISLRNSVQNKLASSLNDGAASSLPGNVKVGSMYRIKSFRPGLYLYQKPGSKLISLSGPTDFHTIFKVHDAGNGKIGLQNVASGNFVGASNENTQGKNYNNDVYIAGTLQPWEKFSLEDAGGGSVLIRSVHNTYINAVSEYFGMKVHQSRGGTAGNQEKFEFHPLAHDDVNAEISSGLFQGDIITTYEEVEAQYGRDVAEEALQAGEVKKRGTSLLQVEGAPRVDIQKWPGGKLYYRFDPNLPQKQKDDFNEAKEMVEKINGINLIHDKDNSAVNHVYVLTGDGCSSYIGMTDYFGGRQDMILGSKESSCGVGSTLHEILHALGLSHEHVTPSAGGSSASGYITIQYDNLKEGKIHNFRPYGNVDEFGYGFDYNSIMMYPEYTTDSTFAKDTRKKIIDCKGHECGQRDFLSYTDIKQIQALYGLSNRRGCKSGGALCGAETTCNDCCTGGYYEYWESKAFTACGKEPCWADGAHCAAGTTCNSCCNSYEYWESKAFTACGKEPCWADGTYCGAGTTCNSCCNSYSYWLGKAFHACGKEPGQSCWGKDTYCFAGTSCSNCCNSWKWYISGAYCL